MKYIYIISLAIISSICLQSCFYDNEEYIYGSEDCGSNPTSYQTQIDPVISQNCAVSGCHADLQEPLLNDVNAVQNFASKINNVVQNGTMPPTGSLSDEDINLINCWINQGALDN